MSWWILLLAGSLEVVWAVGLKYTHGFTKPWPTALTLVTLAASMYLLSMATKELPIGTAYAVWVGIGAAGTALLGMTLLNEPVSLWRLFFLALLAVSIVGLKFSVPTA
ncbi:QacE family quaternary ammonium compound efflux SMR transporter [Bremerella cremea]|uniref:Guanidinium exporter n=1 Tax=Blastopirellula marina TaxID=124 RepID=A0A2S8FSC2_9BACT|nr:MULTISPECIES: multidrug efflux SMR transporter [Pirellulaceae]PQO34950.1 hypothetical protein C5Y83_15845 [Blastopirellula marina]RCS47451.1 QacE family quaternary ammonium compound efflux SMR transporter [Bremerella cremea]